MCPTRLLDRSIPRRAEVVAQALVIPLVIQTILDRVVTPTPFAHDVLRLDSLVGARVREITLDLAKSPLDQITP